MATQWFTECPEDAPALSEFEGKGKWRICIGEDHGKALLQFQPDDMSDDPIAIDITPELGSLLRALERAMGRVGKADRRDA